jgi:hypothetical protein
MLGLLARLPFLPVEGVVKVAEIVRDEADRQLSGSAAARRELEWAANEVAAGRLTAEEARTFEAAVTSRLTRAGRAPEAEGAPDQAPPATGHAAPRRSAVRRKVGQQGRSEGT